MSRDRDTSAALASRGALQVQARWLSASTAQRVLGGQSVLAAVGGDATQITSGKVITAALA